MIIAILELLYIQIELLKMDIEDLTGNKGGIKRHLIHRMADSKETPFSGGAVTGKENRLTFCNVKLFFFFSFNLH